MAKSDFLIDIPLVIESKLFYQRTTIVEIVGITKANANYLMPILFIYLSYIYD